MCAHACGRAGVRERAGVRARERVFGCVRWHVQVEVQVEGAGQAQPAARQAQRHARPG